MEPAAATVISSSAILTGAAASSLIKSIVSNLYEIAKEKAGRQLTQWKATDQIESISKKIRQLRLVKTIWQLEKAVDLTSFYYPSKVKINDKKVIIQKFDDFKYDGSLVLEGTVGQGKSIFLRHLASVEFFLTKRIPVFIELRKIRAGNSLISTALIELQILGFEMDEDLFRLFSNEGKILLFLDGFDEVKEELRESLITEIEDLIRRHSALRIIITSRPNSGISNSTFLRVFQLCPLADKDYEQVIKRMGQDEKTSEIIINGIRNDAAQLSKLLTTPLMVALLMVRYRNDQSLPQNDVAFYDSLFTLLLQRHDRAKAGYIRTKKCGEGDSALQNFFNALCFVTRKSDESSFSKSSLRKYSEESLKLMHINCDPNKILADIIEITCLIITDGDEYRFIHKNVQEYHSALFIKEQPDESAQQFYKAMSSHWKKWQQELHFLELIDLHRFFKYFHIPQLQNTLTLDGILSNVLPVSDRLIIKLCGEDQLGFYQYETTRRLVHMSSSYYWPITHLAYLNKNYAMKILQITRDQLGKHILIKNGEFDTITIKEMIEIPLCQSVIRQSCLEMCETLIRELGNAEQLVQRAEEIKSVFIM